MAEPADQLLLNLLFAGGQCTYGWTPGLIPRCPERATHRACWRKLGVYYLADGATATYDAARHGPVEGGKNCCREHADYYASAWAYTHVVLYPHIGEETWIEVLPGKEPQ